MTTIKQRFIHMTPRKLRLVADSIRGQAVDQAIAALTVTPKVAARPVMAALKSALAAAKQTTPDVTNFAVAVIYVDEGPALKRRILRSKGRASRMEHRMSHLTVSIAPMAPAKPTTKSKITARQKPKPAAGESASSGEES